MADLGQLIAQFFQHVLERVDFFATEPSRLNHVGEHRNGAALKHGVQQLVADLIDALGFGEVGAIEVAVAFALKVEDAFLHQPMEEGLDRASSPLGGGC